MKRLYTNLLLLISVTALAQDNSPLKLWYKQPSGKTWENALPIGNGRLGAMVYGNVDTEKIQLNEHTLWSGSPNRNDNPLSRNSLAEIRSLIFAGKQKEAEQLANKVIISKKSQGQMFEPAGELQLVFSGPGEYNDYYRDLDLRTAVTKTSYRAADITYTREVLASFPDRVVVLHLTASKPGSISFTALYKTVIPGAVVKTNNAEQIAFAGTTIDHEGVKGLLRYKGIVQFVPKGGTATQTDTSIRLANADEVTIFISIATGFNNYNNISGDENERAQGYLNKAVKKTFPRF